MSGQKLCALFGFSNVSNLLSRDVLTVFTPMTTIQAYLFSHGLAKLCDHFQTGGQEIVVPSRLHFSPLIMT